MTEITAIAVRLIMAVLGTIAFAMIYRVSLKRMPFAALGGLLTYAVYELVIQLDGSVLVAALLSATFMTLYSETLARIIHAPAVTFLFPCAIPIVPGGALYRTIYNLLFYDPEKLFNYGTTALGVALGMAVGIGIGSVIASIVFNRKKADSQNKSHP